MICTQCDTKCMSFQVTCVCSSRRLLEDVQQSSQECSGSGDMISFYDASNTSSGEITVTGNKVCGLGDNDVIYDIGSLDSNGNFIPAVLNAYSQIVTVQAGPPSCFQLAVAISQLEQTLSAVRSSIFVQVMDAGRNVSLIAPVFNCHEREQKLTLLRSLSMEASIIL